VCGRSTVSGSTGIWWRLGIGCLPLSDYHEAGRCELRCLLTETHRPGASLLSIKSGDGSRQIAAIQFWQSWTVPASLPLWTPAEVTGAQKRAAQVAPKRGGTAGFSAADKRCTPGLTPLALTTVCFDHSSQAPSARSAPFKDRRIQSLTGQRHPFPWHPSGS
jgi:hypothetical protein